MLIALLALSLANEPDHSVVHGMTVSTPTAGREWGTEAMDGTLDRLQSLGVNWISYHPYARIGRDGSVQSRIDPEHPPAWLLRPIIEAHARGIKVLVKPHLAHWGSGFSWRGDIHFDDPDAQARFDAEYRDWVVTVARLTAEADAFAVGTELDGTLGHEDAWRTTIASVRAVFPGHLTYAANWDAVDRVPFWDALDTIGVQAYYPLADDTSVPDEATLRARWQTVLDPLHDLSLHTGKPVVFTELGYDASPNALLRPWEGGEGNDALQALALSTALDVIDADPVVRGAFLWKWFPGEAQHGDFRMSHPRVVPVLEDAWGGQRR